MKKAEKSQKKKSTNAASVFRPFPFFLHSLIQSNIDYLLQLNQDLHYYIFYYLYFDSSHQHISHNKFPRKRIG